MPNQVNTGKQGGAPALPNNFSGKNSFGNKTAPKIGNLTPQTSTSHNRGKDGTSK
jgi:hypothetical protein